MAPGVQGARSHIQAAEYQAQDTPPTFGNLHDQNVPCAVCYTADRDDKIMIPGKFNCMSSEWTREYYGYLMTEHDSTARNSFECVDVDAESVPGTGGTTDGPLFYFIETDCPDNTVTCPQYIQGNELSCVVCTK